MQVWEPKNQKTLHFCCRNAKKTNNAFAPKNLIYYILVANVAKISTYTIWAGEDPLQLVPSWNQVLTMAKMKIMMMIIVILKIMKKLPENLQVLWLLNPSKFTNSRDLMIFFAWVDHASSPFTLMVTFSAPYFLKGALYLNQPVYIQPNPSTYSTTVLH